MNDQSDRKKAVDLLLKAAPPGSQVILFGSRATGRARPDSDWDFLVVEPEVENRWEEMARLSAILGEALIPADVVVISKADFDRWRDTPGTLPAAVREQSVFYDSPASEKARILLKKAQQDGEAAKRLAEAPTPLPWIVGFHAQQAIEKAFKAVLSARGIPYPRTHNLVMLYTLLNREGNQPPGSPGDYAFLTPFGVVFRYDETFEPAEKCLDVPATLSLVTRVLAWAEEKTARKERP